MLAKLRADQIIDDNKKFSEVPRLLKEQVRAILIEKGREDLLEEQEVTPNE